MAVDFITAFAHVHSIGGTVKYNDVADLALKCVKDDQFSFIPSLIQYNNLSRDTSVEAKIRDYHALASALVYIFNENIVKEDYSVPFDQRLSIFNECNTPNQFERFDTEYCTFIKPFVTFLLSNSDGNLNLNAIADNLRATMLQIDKLHVKPYEDAKWFNDYALKKELQFKNAKISYNLDENEIKELKKHASDALSKVPIPYEIFKSEFTTQYNDELTSYFNDTMQKNQILLEGPREENSKNKRII